MITIPVVVRRRLLKVRDHILASPETFAMEEFVAPSREAAKQWFICDPPVSPTATLRQVEKCGTTCCIVGWYHYVTPKKERSAQVRFTLPQALGASINDEGALIYADMWPEPYRTRFAAAKTAKQEAKVAAARIDYLLETGL